ncbi:MAG TPA: nitrilase-related carbon-nitrogen hydrolase, partial [Pirellulales bacterium]|nr:nitrilase-related carbon-nitrogen hydrolase [Pirellulales bacterium]
RAQHREPDILVNLTNDGWYWGSSELDMHLACAVFRAVECRKPLLIAANTGFSAWIDSGGRIVTQGSRRATDVIVATTTIDHRGSWYLDYGDTLAAPCLVGTCCLAIVGLRERRIARKKALAANS